MTRRRGGRSLQLYNHLDSNPMYQWGGPFFILSPQREPEDWDMLAFRANHTQDSALKDKLFKWLDGHPRPGESGECLSKPGSKNIYEDYTGPESGLWQPDTQE